MITRTLPYSLQDRTGQYTATEYDEIYDRLLLRVAVVPSTQSSIPFTDTDTTLMIYDTVRRSSPHRHAREPAAVLEFGPHGTLGVVSFRGAADGVPMGQYLRKTSMFAGALSRKFTARNGDEYRWIYRAVKDYEWSCVDSRDYIVAHYALKPPDKAAYSTSGNVLTIYEPFTHLAVEIVATLTIMRHLAAGKY